MFNFNIFYVEDERFLFFSFNQQSCFLFLYLRCVVSLSLSFLFWVFLSRSSKSASSSFLDKTLSSSYCFAFLRSSSFNLTMALNSITALMAACMAISGRKWKLENVKAMEYVFCCEIDGMILFIYSINVLY